MSGDVLNSSSAGQTADRALAAGVHLLLVYTSSTGSGLGTSHAQAPGILASSRRAGHCYLSLRDEEAEAW